MEERKRREKDGTKETEKEKEKMPSSVDSVISVDRDFCGWYPSGVMRLLGIILVAILGVGLRPTAMVG
jgi:hypothetical protein